MAEIIVSALLVFGSAFVLLGSLGLVKLPDVYARLHAPTKATTLGVGALIVASAVDHTVSRGKLSGQELLVTVFFFLTAPIGAYLLSKAALHLRLSAGKAELPPPEGE
jgi:multicomponent K+:H+ antiporter subunit G